MEGSKIVKFLIVIFAVLTVVFYSLYYREDQKISVLSESFVEQAVENLNGRGIEIEKDVIIRQIPDENIYVFSSSVGQGYAQIVADAFSACFDAKVVSTSLNTPTGMLFALYDSENTEKQLGKISFSMSDFGFVFSIQGSNITANSPQLVNSEINPDAEKSALIEKIINRLVDENTKSYRITGSISNEEYDIISAAQTFNGLDVSGVYINFVFENDVLVHAFGSWITEKPELGYHEKLTDGINVLYDMDFDNVSSIIGQRIVYCLKKGNSNNYYLLPCWEITTVDSEGNVLKEYFDAI